MSDTTYNGWTNHATWAINLHIDNDYGMYREVTAHIQTINDEQRSYGSFAYTVDRVRLIADYLKDYIEDVTLTDSLNLIQQDMIQTALNLVNWSEIAEAYAKDFPYTGNDDDDADA